MTDILNEVAASISNGNTTTNGIEVGSITADGSIASGNLNSTSGGVLVSDGQIYARPQDGRDNVITVYKDGSSGANEVATVYQDGSITSKGSLDVDGKIDAGNDVEAVGLVHSRTGVKFPDGTIQTTAAQPGGSGSEVGNLQTVTE